VSDLNPAKLHVKHQDSVTPVSPLIPRRYTLTHSDQTGDLFLTIGTDYDQQALNEFQTRLMRDEVLGEWLEGESGPEMHLTCHVSGGPFSFGPAGWRNSIFRRHLPMVIEAMRYGDRALYAERPSLDAAPVLVHFKAWQKRYNITEAYGRPSDYIITEPG
jgi:hypothetical protein